MSLSYGHTILFIQVHGIAYDYRQYNTIDIDYNIYIYYARTRTRTREGLGSLGTCPRTCPGRLRPCVALCACCTAWKPSDVRCLLPIAWKPLEALARPWKGLRYDVYMLEPVALRCHRGSTRTIAPCRLWRLSSFNATPSKRRRKAPGLIAGGS